MTEQRVLVLYGGRSSEHQVSCLSARSVLGAVDRDRYDVIPVGITRDGRWVLTDGAVEPLPGAALPEVADTGATVSLVRGRKGPVLVEFDGGDEPASKDDRVSPRRGEAATGGHGRRHRELGPVDVAFPVLHGPYGEDGTIQGMLATVGVPYVGADVTASSLGIDKRAMKAAFTARGLPLVAYGLARVDRFRADPGAVVDEFAAQLPFPLFTKPARQGSSIGVVKVDDRDGLAEGLDEAFRYDRVAIVEQGVVAARELEIGILGNDVLDVTTPGEVHPSHEFYDFEAKYLDESKLDVPAQLPGDFAARIKDLGRQAYQAIGCRGMARIDFFLDGEQLYVNEINTIPGFTPASMFPRLWHAEGVAYPALVSRLLELALDAADADANYAP